MWRLNGTPLAEPSDDIGRGGSCGGHSICELETSLSEANEVLAGAEAEREALQEELMSSSEESAEALAGVEAERDTLLSRVTTLEGEVAAAATRYAELRPHFRGQ